jgi:hypothetical protein
VSATSTVADPVPSAETELDPATATETQEPAWWWRTRPILALAWLVAAAPTLIAGRWAIVNHVWMAGDRSIMGVFTHDVFTRHTPQLATVSTLGIYTDGHAGPSVHHLGPAQFWALAPIDWLFGGRPMGLVVGAVVINGVAIAIALFYANRRVGRTATALLALVCTVLSFGLGPTILRDIWTPFLGLWLLFALAVVVWSLLEGDRWALPVAAVLVTFLAQIELLFVAPALVFALAGLIGVVIRARRDPNGFDAFESTPGRASPLSSHAAADHDDLFVATGEVPVVTTASGPRPTKATTTAWYRPLVPPAVVSAVIAVFLWSPVAFQEANGNPGNLTLLWRSLGKQKDRAGWGFVGRNLVALFEIRPIWTRRIESPLALGTDVGVLQYGTALVFAGALVVVTVGAWRARRRRPPLLTLCITAWAGVVAGIANLSITPAEGITGLQYRRWMWPVGAWIWFAFLVTAGVLLLERVRRPPLGPDAADPGWPRASPFLDAMPDLAVSRRVVGTLLVVALVAVIPASVGQTSPPTDDIADNRVVASMWPQLIDTLPPQPTYVTLSGATVGFGVGPEIIRRLIVHGFEVWVPSFGADSYGDHRVLPPDLAVPQRLQIGSSLVSLAPTEVPTRLLAAGRSDGRSAARFVAMASAILERVRGAGPLRVSGQGKQELALAYQQEHPGDQADQYAQTVLADPSMAMFDAPILKLHLEGQVVGSPITTDAARRLLDGLKGVEALAFLYPGPRPSSGN